MLNLKWAAPNLRRNSNHSPIRSHKQIESPRSHERGIEAASLPELNKSHIAYQTAKGTGKRPWLDPDYAKVGRSVRIANQSSRHTENTG